MNRRFTNKQEQEIISRYILGESPAKIATTLQTSAVTIRNILYRHNVPRRKSRKLSLEQEYEIVRLYKQGKSPVEISKIYPLTQKAIRNLLHAHNVTIRNRKFSVKETLNNE
jgi:intein-encoded DNA endonuclease-like protein